MQPWLLGLIIGFALLVGLALHIAVLLMMNSPDGERYIKTRMQGPFVPLSKDEIEADEVRKTTAQQENHSAGF